MKRPERSTSALRKQKVPGWFERSRAVASDIALSASFAAGLHIPGCTCFRRRRLRKMARPSKRETAPAPPPTAAAMGKLDELEDCGFDATIRGSVTERTVRPRAADALAAVPMLLERRLETAAAVMLEGTLITAVMATEAARTEMVTSDTPTPAADATADWRALVSM